MASTLRIAALGLAATVMISSSPGAAPVLEMRSVADRVLLQIEEARRAEGLPEWTRLAALDDLAAEAADRAGRDPWGDVGSDISRSIRASRIVNFRRVVPLVQTLRGHDDQVQAAFDQWRNYSGAWNSLLDPSFEVMGIADTIDASGTTVLVAILVEHLVPPGDLLSLEREVADAVNRARTEHGLRALDPDDRLTEVARNHSCDMAQRDYFAHQSPDGLDVSHRTLAAGILFDGVAENLLEILGSDDPAEEAVRQWMRSRGHRKNILDESFIRTAVGVAVSDDGKLYFTQIFIDPVGQNEASKKKKKRADDQE